MTRVLEEWPVEMLGTIQVIVPYVVTQKLGRAVHQRYRAGLASFPQQTQLCGWIEPHISDGKVDQFLNARSGVVEDTEQDGVSSTSCGLEIRLR